MQRCFIFHTFFYLSYCWLWREQNRTLGCVSIECYFYPASNATRRRCQWHWHGKHPRSRVSIVQFRVDWTEWRGCEQGWCGEHCGSCIDCRGVQWRSVCPYTTSFNAFETLYLGPPAVISGSQAIRAYRRCLSARYCDVRITSYCLDS